MGDEEYDEAAALPWDHPDVLHLRGISPDARRLGFDRNTEEGAMLAFTGSLSGAKRRHRLVAWVLLVAFLVPVVIAGLHLLGELLAAVWNLGS